MLSAASQAEDQFVQLCYDRIPFLQILYMYRNLSVRYYQDKLLRKDACT